VVDALQKVIAPADAVTEAATLAGEQTQNGAVPHALLNVAISVWSAVQEAELTCPAVSVEFAATAGVVQVPLAAGMVV
jgi:hypothetical protein